MKLRIALMALLVVPMMFTSGLAQEDNQSLNLDTEESPGLEEAWGVLFTFIRIIQGVAGMLAIYYGAAAALKLQHAGENPQKAQEAKKTLLFAVGGIILVIAAPYLLRELIVQPYLLNPGS